MVCVCPWSQGHRNGLTGVLTGVAESASLLPARTWLQLGGSGPGPEGGSPPVGTLAMGDGVRVRNQTSGPMGEMLIRGYCAAMSKIFKTKEDT